MLRCHPYKKGPLGVPLCGIRLWLAEREPLIPRPKLFKDPALAGQVSLPPGVTPEEAIELTARTPWARGWAEGIAKMAGYKPGTPEYEAAVDTLSHFVARRLLGYA